MTYFTTKDNGVWVIVTEEKYNDKQLRAVSLAGGFLSEAVGKDIPELFKEVEEIEEVEIESYGSGEVAVKVEGWEKVV